MVRKVAGLLAILGGAVACATLSPPPPSSLYIESPTAAMTGRLSLDARITVDEIWAFLRSGQVARARKALLRLGEGHSHFDAGMGYAAFIENDLSGAEAYFLRSIRTTPDLAASYQGLGQIYRKAGRDEEALKAYLEVLKRVPENAFAGREADSLRAILVDGLLADAGAAAAAGETEKAKEDYLRVLEYAPRLRDAHLALARLYLGEKNALSALFHIRAAEAGNPNDVAVLHAFAEALVQTNQLSLGLDVYQRILRIDPNDENALAGSEALKNRLGVVDVPSQYDEIPDRDAVSKEEVAALIVVKFEDVRLNEPAQTPVIVDIASSWARTFIVKVAAFSLMEVFSNHTFQPRAPVNRAEMAQTAARLADLLKAKGRPIRIQIPPERIRIDDVPPEHAFHGPIVQALAYGLMDLAPDRTFQPELQVSGADAIRIFDLLAGLAK